MEFNAEATLMKPSALAVSKRRALIDHLRAVIANLAYGLAVDGLTDLVPALLDINEALGELTDEISQADVIYSDEIIAGTVCLIRTSQALLDDGGIVQTIH
jgi:hypothetical protein